MSTRQEIFGNRIFVLEWFIWVESLIKKESTGDFQYPQRGAQ